MNVFLVTESINNSGLGHLTRCLSLYHAFEEKNITPKMIINSDVAPREVVGRANILQFNWLKNKNRLYKILERADVVVVDSYLAGWDFYRTISRLAKVPVYFDDNKRLFYPSGIVINGALNAEKLNYPAKDYIRYLLGRQFIPLRKEFWEISPKQTRNNIRTILISLGGSDSRNLTAKILKSVNKSYPHQTKKIVIGFDFKNLKDIEQAKDKNTELVFSPDAETMKKLMMEADVAISAAGQTLYELARIGTPAVAIAVVGNQLNNVKAWEETALIKYAGWWRDKELINRMKACLKELENKKLRRDISYRGRILVDGRGSKRIVKTILDTVCQDQGFYVRKANLQDAKNVFELSNDVYVRQNSINRNKILWSAHLKWFKNKIADSHYDFFVIYNNTDEFIGQTRFEILNNYAIISISVAEKFRGKGLSSKILNNSCQHVFQSHRSLKKILAYIRPANISSIHSFKKAGFTFFKEEKINKEEFYVFILNRRGFNISRHEH